MAILTDSGRTALAMALANETLHMAWGTGSEDWDTEPEPEPANATGLVIEVGRRAVAVTQFCVEDPEGDIIVPTGRFQSQVAPSNNLYLKFNFDFTDAESSIIREAAIFMGTILKPNLPAGQLYFLPTDIESPGMLIAVERFPAVIRSGAVRQSFEFVLTL